MIVECSYDPKTISLGPYKLPTPLPYSAEYCNALPLWKLYEVFIKQTDALAVASVNGAWFGCVTEKGWYLLDGTCALHQREIVFPTPIAVPHFQHIGYRKTYPKNLSVYHYPWYLLQNIETGEVLDFPNAHVTDGFPNPHVSLYKSLVTTNYDAIYADCKTGQLNYL